MRKTACLRRLCLFHYLRSRTKIRFTGDFRIMRACYGADTLCCRPGFIWDVKRRLSRRASASMKILQLGISGLTVIREWKMSAWSAVVPVMALSSGRPSANTSLDDRSTTHRPSRASPWLPSPRFSNAASTESRPDFKRLTEVKPSVSLCVFPVGVVLASPGRPAGCHRVEET